MYFNIKKVEFKLEKIFGFRNMQKKLEKTSELDQIKQQIN